MLLNDDVRQSEARTEGQAAEEAMIDMAAVEILNRYRDAFEELAK